MKQLSVGGRELHLGLAPTVAPQALGAFLARVSAR